MKSTLLIPMLLIASLGYSQNFVTAYQTRANMVTQTAINANLTEFASYGAKTTGSAANNSARAWLKAKYKSFGYTDADIYEHPFSYKKGINPIVSSTNLIINKVGTTYPNKYIIICGHFDTIVGQGVNDNGSGVAAILEAARILKNVPTEYSIKFINFSGEEQGLYGSQAYVTNVVNSTNPKMDIKLVFNIDQVGGLAGENTNKIICERDESTPNDNDAASNTFTTELRKAISLYSPLQTVLSNAYSSDYMPFQSNGEVITGIYESTTANNNNPHSSTDIITKMDPGYVFKVAKGVVGAIQHFAGASTSTIVLSANDVKKELKDRVSIFPNPANDFINIGIDGKGFVSTVIDLSGRTLITSKDEQTINTSKLKNGIYLLTVVEDGQSTTKKFIIK